MSSVPEQEKCQAIEFLRDRIQVGTTVYMILRHTSQSGMSRVISSYAIERDEPIWLDPFICRATGLKLSDRYEGVGIRGTGMDMGSALLRHVCGAIDLPLKGIRHRWL